MKTYSTGATTKLKMINAAGELAVELGLDNVSTRAVAERSGVNIGSIHYHFGSKDGLFEAMVHEAMDACMKMHQKFSLDELEANPDPVELARIIRQIVADEIATLFCAGRSVWHAPLIYQLLQRDDALYELFRDGHLEPELQYIARLLRIIKPKLSDDEVFLHFCLMKMPIFSHANHMKAMLKYLKMPRYSEEYLKKLEDLLTRQTLRLLDLPED